MLDDRRKDFDFLIDRLQWIASIKGAECMLYLLVIPHSCQVSRVYLERTKQLGAVFENESLVQQDDYPFVQQLRDRAKDAVVIDPMGVFKEAEKSGVSLYLTNDIHLTPKGNEVLSQYVTAVLMSHNEHPECRSSH